jgi:hypothetical protein
MIMISDDCSIVGSQDDRNDGCGYNVIWAQWYQKTQFPPFSRHSPSPTNIKKQEHR